MRTHHPGCCGKHLHPKGGPDSYLSAMVLLALLMGLVMFLSGCGPGVKKSHDGPTATNECNNLCQKKYNTDVDYVGAFSGTCYCK